MVTVEDLYRIARREDGIADELHALLFVRAPCPVCPAMLHDEWTKAMLSAQRRRDQALMAASWLEREGRREARFVGPFGNPLPQRGQTVRVKRGVEVSGTGKNHKVVSGRSDVVTVHRVVPGWAERDGVRNPLVVWAGTGGYWRWTDANNVEIIP